MPFTFAHPAAALPLARILGRYGVPSALAIGSMTPDAPYFLGLTMKRAQTHDIETLLGWSLPVGLMIYVLFHLCLRQALIDLMPAPVQQRLAGQGQLARGWSDWAAVAVSLLTGAATHLVWDAFTHEGTFAVDFLPVLQVQLGTVAGHAVYVFHLLQFASSGLGLLLLAAWGWRWYWRADPAASTPPAFSPAARWTLCAALTMIPVAAGAWGAWGGGWDPQRAPRFVLTTLPVFFWMLTSFALAVRLRRGAK